MFLFLLILYSFNTKISTILIRLHRIRNEHYATSLDGIDVAPSVKTFHLSSEILDNIPEKERLLFVMDNTNVTNIFVHQKFVDIFKKHNIQGTRFIKVSKYRFGMEFV